MIALFDVLVALTNLLTSNIKLIIVLSESITVFSESITVFRIQALCFQNRYHVLVQSGLATYFSYGGNRRKV